MKKILFILGLTLFSTTSFGSIRTPEKFHFKSKLEKASIKQQTTLYEWGIVGDFLLYTVDYVLTPEQLQTIQQEAILIGPDAGGMSLYLQNYIPGVQWILEWNL
jgi:hypothetical protein